MAANIINTEGYTPPEHKYKKMSTNKYALNVLKNFKDAPKFIDGCMVQIRSTIGRTFETKQLAQFRNRLCFVINSDLKVLSATKGGKRYSVLPMGHHLPLELEERNLMKPNKRGTTT